MSSLEDVQNAIVNIITPAIYPNGTGSPSVLQNQVTAIIVTSGGTGYTNATVTITGNGYGATASAVISSGVITQINVFTFGTNYTSASVVITGDGTGAMATATLTSNPVYVAPGDFLKEDLDSGLAIGAAFISVFAIKGMIRNTTRLRRIYSTEVVSTPTITLTVLNNTVTVGGTITVGQSSMVIVNGKGYAYAALSGDTTTTIATALTALIPTATSIGPVITIADAYSIVARVSVAGSERQILHSQEGMFRARVIAPSHQTRELLGNALQLGIAENGYYMDMPDLISASIRPNTDMEVNTYELANAFARDYVYLVEYHVVQVTQFQTIADAYIVEKVSTT